MTKGCRQHDQRSYLRNDSGRGLGCSCRAQWRNVLLLQRLVSQKVPLYAYGDGRQAEVRRLLCLMSSDVSARWVSSHWLHAGRRHRSGARHALEPNCRGTVPRSRVQPVRPPRPLGVRKDCHEADTRGARATTSYLERSAFLGSTLGGRFTCLRMLPSRYRFATSTSAR